MYQSTVTKPDGRKTPIYIGFKSENTIAAAALSELFGRVVTDWEPPDSLVKRDDFAGMARGKHTYTFTVLWYEDGSVIVACQYGLFAIGRGMDQFNQRPTGHLLTITDLGEKISGLPVLTPNWMWAFHEVIVCNDGTAAIVLPRSHLILNPDLAELYRAAAFDGKIESNKISELVKRDLLPERLRSKTLFDRFMDNHQTAQYKTFEDN